MLDPAQVASFHADGFLVLRGLIRGHELAALRAAADRVQEEAVARVGEHSYSDAGIWRRSERMWRRDPVFRAVTVNPGLLAAVGQCLGEAFFPWNDSLVVKMPRSTHAVAWHQDPPYMAAGRTETYAVPNFIADIYLDRSTVENGCVRAFPGHHMVGHIPAIRTLGDAALFASSAAVPVEMEPGDVLLHSPSLPHGSPPNPTDTLRRTFYVHFLCEEVRQHDYVGSHLSHKPMWNAEHRALIEQMIADRRALGFGDTPGARVRLGEAGFETVGLHAPRRAWAGAASAISAERAEAMRRLEVVAGAQKQVAVRG